MLAIVQSSMYICLVNQLLHSIKITSKTKNHDNFLRNNSIKKRQIRDGSFIKPGFF